MEDTAPETAGREPAANETPPPSRAERPASADPGDAAEEGSTTSAAPEDGAAAPAKPKRRRGRRGGRRHRRPGAARPGAQAAAADDGSENGEDTRTSDTAAEGAPAAKPARTGPPRQRRPAQQARPRAPRAGARPKPAGASSSASDPDGSDTHTAGAPAEASEAADATGAPATADGQAEAADQAARPKRRRRRGGRGRGGRSKAASTTSENGDAATEAGTQEASTKEASTKDASTKEPAPAASGNGGATTQKPRAERKPRAPAAKGGSTRLEARAQRAQQRPRRRPRRLSGDEARLLRGSDKLMVIHEHDDRTQIAVLEGNALAEHFVAHGKGKSIAGNVYLGRVQNVLSGMEAAFVDIGKGRNAVLYAGEVNYAPEDLEGEAAPRIEKILKPGQPVLVQVTKDPLGTKGARLTAQISLAGRYMVLAPEQQLSGISRRLAEDERARLRQILRSMKTDGHGLIVRTAADGATEEALGRDLENLKKIWAEIKAKQKKEKAPALLYSEPELVMRVARDIFSGDFAKVVVDSKRIYDTLRSYLEETGPDLVERLELYEGALPILEQYHVSEQIQKALERKVWLPSGGSIVIDRTEAMTVIDVNTSKFVGKGGSLEETVFKNNLEAAEEVARQLRLRDIGGIIVIDFIDMIIAANREQVLRTLKRALSRDKTRSQVFDVSSLGLVEMTRKKVSEGLLEAFSEPCPNCEGRGIVITHEID